MASTSPSSGPNPTSQLKQARSRKATAPGEQNVSGRAGSAGGILLEKNQVKKPTSVTPQPASRAGLAHNVAALSPSRDTELTSTTAPAGPNRQRRRPRKLNREPASTQDASTTSVPVVTNTQASSAPTTELEALKSRVRGLEAKVEELYKSTETRTGRSPRRRGKGRKNSFTQAPPVTTDSIVTEHDEDEVDEELIRLEGELDSARRDLELYHPRTRPKSKRSPSGDTEPVEEITRDDVGEEMLNTGDRKVTLTGSYRIPLPTSVSMADVKTIQSGVSAAQNVARSFLEQRRATQAARNAATNTAPATAAPKPSKKSSNMEITRDTEGKSWSEWFGGYSLAISRAVKNIEAEAALESQKVRPTMEGRTTSAPSATKKGAGTVSGKKRSGGNAPAN